MRGWRGSTRERVRLQRDAAARHSLERLAHRLRRGAYLLFPSQLALFVQHTVLTGAIPQVQSDRQFRLGKIAALLRRHGANLLHCRSPLSVVLASTSITWERTASRRETGLLPRKHSVKRCALKHYRMSEAFQSWSHGLPVRVGLRTHKKHLSVGTV